MNTLQFLAHSVVKVFVAGPQRPVTITALGRTFDTDRAVRVEDGEIAWEGPLTEWQRALVAECQR